MKLTMKRRQKDMQIHEKVNAIILNETVSACVHYKIRKSRKKGAHHIKICEVFQY